jgi:hypothetical protein
MIAVDTALDLAKVENWLSTTAQVTRRGALPLDSPTRRDAREYN